MNLKKTIDSKNVERFLSRVKQLQTKNKFDLSIDEDLSIAIMNLISIEEHMFFTAAKTKKLEYLDVLNEARQMRKTLLKEIIKDYEGEGWCISKHLLAASMRLNEVGTKKLNNHQKQEAWKFFQMAYQLYSLFWGLNLGVIKSQTIKTSLTQAGFKPKEFSDTEPLEKSKNNKLFDKLGDLVKKAIDCCIE